MSFTVIVDSYTTISARTPSATSSPRCARFERGEAAADRRPPLSSSQLLRQADDGRFDVAEAVVRMGHGEHEERLWNLRTLVDELPREDPAVVVLAIVVLTG